MVDKLMRLKKTLLACAIFIFIRGTSCKASSFAISTYSNWQSGSSVNIDDNATFGSIQLLSQAGVVSDEFEAGFLKPAWTAANLSAMSFSSLGEMHINADGNQANGAAGIGVESKPFPVTGGDGVYETLVNPTASGYQFGGLYMTGILEDTAKSFSGNYVYLYFNSQGQVGAWINMTGTATQINYTTLSGVGACRLRIAKTGCNYSLSYLSPTAQVWVPLTSTSFAMSSTDMVVGLGNIIPPTNGYGGISDYSYFRVTPYAESGTWTSAALDRGGVPVQAGTISWQADNILAGVTSVSITTRTSPDKVNWSAWSGAYSNPLGSAITSPQARYIQVQAMLSTTDTARTPVLRSIRIDQPDFSGALLAKENVKFWDNPARSSPARILYELAQPASRVHVRISDANDRVLLDEPAPAGQGQNEFDWDIHDKANGVYLVKITAQDGGGNETSVVKGLAVLK